MKELKREESKRAAANIRRKLDLESTRYSTCVCVFPDDTCIQVSSGKTPDNISRNILAILFSSMQ